MHAKCIKKGCDYKIYASPMQGKTTLQIKTFLLEYSYANEFQNNLVTSTIYQEGILRISLTILSGSQV